MFAFNLSRSAIKRARIFSVGIERILSLTPQIYRPFDMPYTFEIRELFIKSGKIIRIETGAAGALGDALRLGEIRSKDAGQNVRDRSAARHPAGRVRKYL
jgi:hypothetical protein